MQGHYPNDSANMSPIRKSDLEIFGRFTCTESVRSVAHECRLPILAVKVYHGTSIPYRGNTVCRYVCIKVWPNMQLQNSGGVQLNELNVFGHPVPWTISDSAFNSAWPLNRKKSDNNTTRHKIDTGAASGH